MTIQIYNTLSRKKEPLETVEQNLVLEDLGSFTRRGLLDRGAVRRHAEAMIERFEIKATPTTPVGTK